MEHSSLTFAVFPASVSVTYESVKNSSVSCHVTYDIEEEKEQDNPYSKDCH